MVFRCTASGIGAALVATAASVAALVASASFVAMWVLTGEPHGSAAIVSLVVGTPAFFALAAYYGYHALLASALVPFAVVLERDSMTQLASFWGSKGFKSRCVPLGATVSVLHVSKALPLWPGVAMTSVIVVSNGVTLELRTFGDAPDMRSVASDG